MKIRFIAAALFLAMLLFVFGCSDGGTGETPAAERAASEATQAPVERKEFIFTRENFPRMDGSTSTAPLAEAAASVLLGEPREAVAELAMFNRTTQSFRNLANGETDILIVSEPVPEVFEELRMQGFEIEIAPIALDALVFIVNTENPVNSLNLRQLQRIYTGQITNWSEVGGENKEIIAFQRNAEAGSQVLMEKLVMQGISMSEPPMHYMPQGMGELITSIQGFDGSANAIGYTVFFFAENMGMAHGLKIIDVDGVSPNPETIRSGEYPFTNPYFAVIGAHEPEDSPARIMWQWLQSAQGQALINKEGYVSIR